MLSQTLFNFLLVFSLLEVKNFVHSSEDCEPLNSVPFTEVVRNAVQTSGLKLSAIAEFLVAYRPRNPSVTCGEGFEPELWPSSVIPYVISDGFSSLALQKINAELKQFSEKTCVKFTPLVDQDFYLKLRPVPNHCFLTLKYLGLIYSRPFTPGFAWPSERTTLFQVQSPNTPPDPKRVVQILLPNSYVEREGVLGHVLQVLGLSRQEVRHDRDMFISMGFKKLGNMYTYAFAKNVPSVVDRMFSYDAESATQMSAAAARYWNIALSSRHRNSTLRSSYTGKMSKMDAAKVNFLYCGKIFPESGIKFTYQQMRKSSKVSPDQAFLGLVPMAPDDVASSENEMATNTGPGGDPLEQDLIHIDDRNYASVCGLKASAATLNLSVLVLILFSL
ncbi:uncharacterized protein LOC108675613 isoform X2 [Hyalella azteca]|uniref:Uncharacterized protein LOC108675613 isoform X2 n=1 Tax=Hyalella azteca TaxID=294128 RepID=A0A8B7NZL0_HYAAZ|nr:uncharacterized protein LOC108675613 isoform X2 [Hyalella azteca]